jgi:Tol biopolymer transport system component
MYPVSSPDGKYLAFSSDKNGNFDLWIMDLESGETQVVDTNSATEAWSAWGPESKRIYFTSDRSGVFNIWTASLEGGEILQITEFDSPTSGLPESALLTKFALSKGRVVFPLEIREGDVYIMEGFD